VTGFVISSDEFSVSPTRRLVGWSLFSWLDSLFVSLLDIYLIDYAVGYNNNC
jgi:hypothetical protein